MWTGFEEGLAGPLNCVPRTSLQHYRSHHRTAHARTQNVVRCGGEGLVASRSIAVADAGPIAHREGGVRPGVRPPCPS
eukprot:2490761-Prymnesium_polylepis.1